MDDFDGHFYFGENQDREASVKLLCEILGESDCTKVEQFADMHDTLSKKTFEYMAISQNEEEMLSKWYDDYDTSQAKLGSDYYIDFS